MDNKSNLQRKVLQKLQKWGSKSVNQSNNYRSENQFINASENREKPFASTPWNGHIRPKHVG